MEQLQEVPPEHHLYKRLQVHSRCMDQLQEVPSEDWKAALEKVVPCCVVLK